jgi:propionyl-CoA synthetase
MARYKETHRRSLTDPEGFWGEAAKHIDWITPPAKVLDRSDPNFPRWFSGGVLNTCYNAIDRHVESGRADQPAIIYDSPVTGVQRTITYEQFLGEVSRFAGVLASFGVAKGDRVVIYMPMVPEALVAMLACARIGAIHSVVFGGFAARELAIRIDDAKPKVVVSASCGIEGERVIEYKPLLDQAIEIADHKPEHCVVLTRPQAQAVLEAPRDLDWGEAMATATPASCVPVAATDPLYILYTSGTTAMPKGVVRDNGGHAVALRWTMDAIYETGPGEVYWAASDIGWVVGHSYIVYAPLLAGATTVLYEGKPVGTPDPGAFWRVISEHKVKTLFTAPTAFRAIKKEDPEGTYLKKYDPSRRAAGPRHLPLGLGAARQTGDRPLVADRDRLGHRRQLHGDREAPREGGVPVRPRPWLRRADPGLRGQGTTGRDRGDPRDPPAASPGMPADAVGRRRAVHPLLPRRLPGLVRDRGRRLHR